MLETDESSDIYKGIHVPKEWTNETASNFKTTLIADAIQAEHFTPDFESDAPWGAIEIEEAKAEDGIDYRAVTTVKDVHTLN